MSWLCCINFCKRPTVNSVNSSINKHTRTVIFYLIKDFNRDYNSIETSLYNKHK